MLCQAYRIDALFFFSFSLKESDYKFARELYYTTAVCFWISFYFLVCLLRNLFPCSWFDDTKTCTCM